MAAGVRVAVGRVKIRMFVGRLNKVNLLNDDEDDIDDWCGLLCGLSKTSIGMLLTFVI